MKLEWGQITISSIFSLLLGIIIGHWLAIKRDKRKEFIAAGKEFREAFSELQSDIHLGSQNTWKLISKHRQDAVKAKIKFEPVLSPKKRAVFEKAWNEIWNREISDFKTSGNCEEEVAMRNKVLTQINKIIKFTK